MSAKKRKNKKYNPVEGAKRAARMGLKNLAVWHSQKTESDYTAELVNVKTYRTIPVGESTVFAITKIRHNWQVYITCII